MKNLKLNIKLAQNIQSSERRDDQSSKLECTKVIENIYLSSYHTAADISFLKNLGITHIINCATGSRHFKNLFLEEIEYLLLDIKDEPGYDLIYSIYLTIDFIEKCIKIGGKILIHCFEGVSRGPALLSSYLMWKLNIDKISALHIIKEKRKCIDINLGFLYQLDKWEEFIRFNKEFKFYKFGREGAVTLLDREELTSLENSFSFLLMVNDHKFFKIINKAELNIDDTTKVDKLINLLQTYENYPKQCYSLYIENSIHTLEEIIKGY